MVFISPKPLEFPKNHRGTVLQQCVDDVEVWDCENLVDRCGFLGCKSGWLIPWRSLKLTEKKETPKMEDEHFLVGFNAYFC